MQTVEITSTTVTGNHSTNTREETHDVENQQADVNNDLPSSYQNAESNGAIPQQDSVKKEEDDGGLLTSVVKVVLPFLFFDLLSTTGRRDYVDFLLEGQMGGLITWIPFILVLALASVHALLALWLSFGVSIVILMLQFYHGTYKPNYARFYWFTVSNCLTYLTMGIVYLIVPFDSALIGVISVTSLLVTVLVSLLVRHPFTMQHAREQVSNEVATMPSFLTLNMYLTSFWLLLFVIMAASAWAAYPLPDGTASLILGTIIPIAVPIVGMKMMPFLVDYLKGKTLGLNQS